MKDCKYRLPCNWCDRLNKYCDMVESIKIELPDTNKCDHDWVLESTYQHPEDIRNRWYKRYVCSKCGMINVKEL